MNKLLKLSALSCLFIGCENTNNVDEPTNAALGSETDSWGEGGRSLESVPRMADRIIDCQFDIFVNRRHHFGQHQGRYAVMVSGVNPHGHMIMLFQHPSDVVALAPNDSPDDFGVTAMRV